MPNDAPGEPAPDPFEVAFEMVPPPPVGRAFVGERRVRLGDVDPSGRLRLDALTRYTQDVSNDDTTDAGLADGLAWVVRRTVVEVLCPAVLGEELSITTFCSRLGRRWAERRLRVIGADGGRYDVASLWVHIDERSGRPRQLPEQFLSIYGTAAEGRTVTARLVHPSPPGEVQRRPWPLRAVDFDTLQHMNNAAYWAAVEDVMAERPMRWPYRAVIEYGGGIAPGSTVTLLSADEGGSHFLWWEVGGQRPASASLTALSSVPEPDGAGSGAMNTAPR